MKLLVSGGSIYRLILIDLITLTIFGNDYKLRSASYSELRYLLSLFGHNVYQ